MDGSVQQKKQNIATSSPVSFIKRDTVAFPASGGTNGNTFLSVGGTVSQTHSTFYTNKD